HSPLASRQSPLATRHSPLATRHSPLATRHSPLVLRVPAMNPHFYRNFINTKLIPHLIHLLADYCNMNAVNLR
ncbi:MAG: hypothetical protein ACI9ES_001513, partial [Oceanospirillaceae bacterium]